MREWNLKISDPLSLTLAADARLGNTVYNDDQVWELALGGGEPPALALQTSYGLRARSLRLFPRFSEGDRSVSNPADFIFAPVVKQIFPNYILITFSPLPQLEVEIEYWAPQSNGVTGRILLRNTGERNRHIRLEWAALLTPNDGQRMAGVEIQACQVLAGRTGGLAPVVFLSGGPSTASGSYPALTLPVDLEAGGERSLAWASASLGSSDESFTLARNLVARRYEAERARLELLNAGEIEIYTGDPDWDAAFHLAQKTAFGLFIGPTSQLPAASFTLARQPDLGYSFRGDGSDYSHLWNGQPPLEAFFLAGLVLPSAPHLIQGVLRNYLATQAEDGFIDWKPGLGGQRSRLMATPILVSIAWRVYQSSEDLHFLEDVFPGLLKFVQAWFAPPRDRDGDRVPEWDHPMQAGIEDNPLYARWHVWAQGAEISTAESPALCSFLYRECRLLGRIAGLLGQADIQSDLNELAEVVRLAVEAAWQPEEASYFDWDRDTHFTTRGEWLGRRSGPGEMLIGRGFPQAIRLLVKIQIHNEATRRPNLFVYGASASGKHRIEQMNDERFKWYLGVGTLTGERVYSAVEKLDIQGIDNDDVVDLYAVDYLSRDISVLLPLWAGIPAEERAMQLIEKTILDPNRYWKPFGLPSLTQSPAGISENEAAQFEAISMPWNALIAEGLVRYGVRETAVELITRLMGAVVASLKRDTAFRHGYNARTGQGIGERNALSGLAPLASFLEVLGVRLISPTKVALAGYNPFPWPVTVKYRGMTVLRQKDKTTVIFPDGQTTQTADPAPQVIMLKSEGTPVVERPDETHRETPEITG